MDKQYCVYIITNIANSVLYTGVTNDLKRRIVEHKEGLIEGFSKRYNLYKLIYYETTNDILSAITREKQIKNMSRKKKEDLIGSLNANWHDMFGEL